MPAVVCLCLPHPLAVGCQGFPIRLEYLEFVRRYQVLAFPATLQIPAVDLSAASVKILTKVPQKFIAAAANPDAPAGAAMVDPGSYWELGKTKIFMKYYVVSALMAALDQFHYRAIVIQRHVRGLLAKRHMERTYQPYPSGIAICAHPIPFGSTACLGRCASWWC